MRAAARLGLVVVLFLSLARVVAAQGPVVLKGYPLTRLNADHDGEVRQRLSEAESGEFHVRIEMTSPGCYVLASRGNVPLTFTRAGAFLFFQHGGGLIKVADPRLRLPDPKLRELLGESPPGIDYMEVMHTMLRTVTYWGRLAQFRSELLTSEPCAD